MTKPIENWVEQPCDHCGKPSGVKLNTRSELYAGFKNGVISCPDCLSQHTNKGRLLNNIIIPRDDNNEPWLFYKRTDGTIVANLDRYAIIPKEEYERLRAVCEDYEKARPLLEAAIADVGGPCGDWSTPVLNAALAYREGRKA